jgi:hypothetical protein
MRTQPAAVTFANRSVLSVLLVFGLIQWDEPQLGAVYLLIDAVTSLILSRNVTTQATLKDACTSQALIVAQKAANDARDQTPPPSFTSRL